MLLADETDTPHPEQADDNGDHDGRAAYPASSSEADHEDGRVGSSEVWVSRVVFCRYCVGDGRCHGEADGSPELK